MLSPKSGETVAFPALGTGYGHLSKGDFGAALGEIKTELLSRYPGTIFYLVEKNTYAGDELTQFSNLESL